MREEKGWRETESRRKERVTPAALLRRPVTIVTGLAFLLFGAAGIWEARGYFPDEGGVVQEPVTLFSSAFCILFLFGVAAGFLVSYLGAGKRYEEEYSAKDGLSALRAASAVLVAVFLFLAVFKGLSCLDALASAEDGFAALLLLLPALSGFFSALCMLFLCLLSNAMLRNYREETVLRGAFAKPAAYLAAFTGMLYLMQAILLLTANGLWSIPLLFYPAAGCLAFCCLAVFCVVTRISAKGGWQEYE